MEELHESFKSLLIKNSIDSSKRMNQDCYQELSLQFILAVNAFDLAFIYLLNEGENNAFSSLKIEYAFLNY